MLKNISPNTRRLLKVLVQPLILAVLVNKIIITVDVKLNVILSTSDCGIFGTPCVDLISDSLVTSVYWI